uniref:Neurogenic locus notch protein 1 n=1 Tax=Ascaris suum TaxID=6253 RepID=F1KPM5_ASCSU
MYFHTLKMRDSDVVSLESGSKLITISSNNPPTTRFRSLSSRVLLDVQSNSASLVLVASFSKDCPPLQVNSSLLAMFSHASEYNSLAQLSCRTGFTLLGNETLQCHKGGVWSAETPTCRATFCPMPFIKNGYLLNVSGFEVNSWLSFGCQLGYNDTSKGMSVCQSNATWIPIPTCEPINCGSPESSYNSATLVGLTRGTSLYSRATYSCTEGMHLVGTNAPYRICETSGHWSTPAFRCEAPICYATSIAFGQFTQTLFTNGSYGNYTCRKGFVADAAAPLCVNGTWNTIPVCKSDHSCLTNPCGHGTCVQLNGGYTCDCPKGYRITSFNGNTTCEDIDECRTPGYSLCDQYCTNTDGSYYCTCADDYWLYGRDAVNLTVLTVNTTFLVANHSCIRKRCPTPPVPQLAYEYPYLSQTVHLENGLYHTGCTLTFQCMFFGYNIILTNLTCLSNGTWQQSSPCPAITCLRPSTTQRELRIEPYQEIYTHGDVIHFSCSEPFQLVGPTQSICQDNNLWSVKKPPVCSVQRCPDVNFNGAIFVQEHNSDLPDNVPGYKYILVCNNGYEFEDGSGSVAIECVANYTWSRKSIPLCIPKRCSVEQSEELVPLKKSLISGESTSFHCQQNDYFLSGSSSTTCVARSSSYTSDVIETYDDCISHISPETYASLGSSAVLWCIVNERCANFTVSWRRSRPTEEDLVTIKRGLFKYAVFFERAQLSDQDSYQCVVSSNGRIIDQKFADFFVHYLSEEADSWTNVMAVAQPVKEVLLDSRINQANWVSSKDWEQTSEGTWVYRYRDGRNFIMNSLLEVAPEWATISVSYKIDKCASCTLHLKLLRPDATEAVHMDIAKFITVAELFANESYFRLQPRTMAFVAVAIESNSPSAYVYSLDVLVTKCPPIKIGLVEFPETITQQNMVEVAGECVAGASTYDGSQPTLSCSSQGRWFSSQQLISTCVCKKSHSTYHGKCVLQGPICYECSNGTRCDATSATHCEPGDSCFTSTQIGASKALAVNKGCTKHCRSTFTNFERCLRGEESCQLCCVSDYCNWAPSDALTLQLRGDVPICIDARPISIECVRQINVLKHSRSFVSPVSVPFPTVRDNDPYYTLTSSIASIDSAPYAFDGTVERVVWNVTDRHGKSETCVTRIVYEDRWPPVLKCPEIYFDYVPNTTSSVIAARLPVVAWTDASDVQLMYEPLNGTRVEINEPLRVIVTAVDEHGNLAKCSFWYIAKVSDCPLWQINQTEYNCIGSLTQRLCTRKSPCQRQYPSNVQAISCTAGSGWRYIVTGSEADESLERPEMSRPPVCIPERTSSVQISVTMELMFNRSICVSPVADQIYEKLAAITGENCVGTKWQHNEYLTNGSRLTILLITREANLSTVTQCADHFVTGINVGSIVVKNACDGFQVRSQTANYSIHCDGENCPSGFYVSQIGCQLCPVGTYSDRRGSKNCKQCPYGLSTVHLGSFSVKQCYEHCPPGYFSASGLAPCRACAVGFYQPANASKDCIECGQGTTTASPGATSESNCTERCMPGWFSRNGLQPCIACPFGFYQPNAGQSKCLRCPEGSVTLQPSATTLLQCTRLTCADNMCQNGAKCVDKKCECGSGYAGRNCGVAMNLCQAEYCLNDAQCFFDGNSTHCQCPNGFAGLRCEQHVTVSETPPPPPSPCTDISLCPNGACISTGNSYICECHDGYKNAQHSRQLCVPMDACDFHPCGSGECLHSTMNTFQCFRNPAKTMRVSTCAHNGIATSQGNCLCPPPFYGPVCADQNDVCSLVNQQNACGTGGCIQDKNQFSAYYFCKCEDGTFGEACSKSAPCSDLLPTTPRCDYGVCTASGMNSSCVCIEGFQGANCSLEIDMCTRSPCRAGSCLKGFNSFSCVCPEDYDGDFCEKIISPCTSDACAEGGRCSNFSMGHDGKYNCTCPRGWQGVRCTEDVDFCHSSLCAQQSTCVDLLADSYECFCPPDRRGRYCDVPVDFCSIRNPCFNGAQCIGIPWGYRCSCSPGYTGANCEDIIDHCQPNPCQNDAMCSSNLFGYHCECTPEYIGMNCSEHINPCKVNGTVNYCMNEAACYVEGVVARCQCSYQFTGDRCETKKTQSYNLYFTGRASSQEIVSISVNGSLLDKFSLCGWVKPGPQDALQGSSEATTPFVVLVASGTKSPDEELLSISCAGVKIENTFVAQYTLKVRIWHHICIRYFGDGVMSVLLNAQGVAVSDKRLRQVRSQVHLLLGQSTNDEDRFVGEISLVQLYNRVLSDAEVLNMTYDCQRWLKSQSASQEASVLVKWNQFSTVSIQNPSIYALYPGICVSSGCLPGHSQSSSDVYDKIPPMVVSCPTDQYVVSEKRLTRVSWQPSVPGDIFFDNVILSDVFSNYRSGDIFSWGEYHVMYIARDEAGNIGTCEFDVIVSPRNCTDPPNPRNGSANIVKLDNSDARRVAFLHCNVGYLFADEMPDFFTCDLMGQWSRFHNPLHYRFPACSAYIPPEQRLNGTVSVDGDCSNIASIEQTIMERVALANENFGGTGFCITPNCTGELQLFSSCDTRTKRSPAPQPIDVTYVLSVNTTRSPISSFVNSSIYEQYGENSRPPTTEWLCNDPEYKMLLFGELNSCVRCTVGYYLNNSVCTPCPENTYKDTEGNGPCKKCEDGKVTGTIGAVLPSDCYNNCTPGSYYYPPTANCKQCERGTFQPGYGAIQCFPCDPGSSTPTIGASSEAECNITCGAGFYMGVNEACVGCPQGSYRPDDRKIVQCISCNIGFTTPHLNSTSASDCSVMNCPPGTFTNANVTGPLNQEINHLSQICLQCPIGYYQDQWNESACVPCGTGFTTSNTGASSVRYCLLSPATVLPSTAIAPQEKADSPPWITWLIVAIAGGIAALIFSSVLVIYRKRLRNLLHCCKNPDIKTMATTDYYRDTTYTYPIVTSLSPTTNVPQMIEIYNEIFTGLQKMADGSEDSRARDFEDVEAAPPSSLTVDTSLRAIENFGPKAIGMDSSGFPIDSADYERFGYGKQSADYSSTFESLIRGKESAWDEQSALRRRFEAISEPFYNEAAANEWRRRISYGGYGHGANFGTVHDYENSTNYAVHEHADDDDDEDYFG